MEPLEDATNRSNAHLRNRVRHELLPLLRTFNPRIEEALVRLSAAAAEDAATIEELVATALTTGVLKNGEFRVSRSGLTALPDGLRGHVIRSAIEQLVGTTRSISERHVLAALRASETTGTELDLPHGLHVEVQRDAMVMSTSPLRSAGRVRRVRLPVPGKVCFGDWEIESELLDKAPTRLAQSNGVATALLDAEAIGPELWLRPRKPGDRYQPLGLGHERKLQDVLVDAHVPRSERDALPLLCSEDGIAWVPGSAPAEWAKITSKTRRTVRVRAAHKGMRSEG